MSELDALDPIPETVVLRSGTVVVLEDLRARQFFKLLRIITHGALPAVVDSSLSDLNVEDTGEFVAKLLSLMVLSIPDAEDETIEFVRSMCQPQGLIEGRKLNKADTERNNALWAVLDAELGNPDLDDLVTIIEAIVRREAEDIQALGKRLAVMLRMAEKTGQLKSQTQGSKTTTGDSLEDSPESSTSSPENTDGPTPPSPTSASNGSGNASRRSGNARSTPGGNETNG